ncbi:hypothetical protein DPMN_009509 [Dreissena polymorpha]|uniref:Uncharacterized protein n=1 Tax=Dreissena polymorpha TaxID=45954 RepID=A0A9D4N1D9_DREPO|nr:hypothetical protein DPMN_009509 [Dreissena polymorpha]
MDLFEQESIKHYQTLTVLWNDVETIINSDFSNKDVVALQQIETDLNSKLQAYDIKYKEFYEFLSAKRTSESSERLNELSELNCTRLASIQPFKDQLINKMQANFSLFSPVRSNCPSNASHSSSVKAKAAAAQATLLFTQKEVELRKKQASLEEKQLIAEAVALKEKKEIEIALILLKAQQAAAETKAEVEVLDDVSDICKESMVSLVNEINPVNVSKQEVNTCTMNESITKFMLRKDLALSRLTQFTDKPQEYQGWKVSFKKTCEDMDATPAEEIDL